MAKHFHGGNLEWRGDRLGVRSQWATQPSLRLVRDGNLWRVRLPDGETTDAANHTRAKDAARSALLSLLNEKSPG